MSYADVASARAEGITTSQADDTRLQALLDDASRFIDDATGQWFEPRTFTLRVDGPGDPVLYLPAPCIALTSCVVDEVVQLPSDVVLYGTPGAYPDQRWNPRALRRCARWPKGLQNVVLTGSFGFVEADGVSPPSAIREACLRLTVRSLALLADADGQAERRRAEVFRETTDGHSYELASTLPGAAGAWRRSGLTGDPDIDQALARYRRAPAGGRV